LEKYLPAWVVILGSANEKLCYFDCFAGPGRYETIVGPTDGSPVVAVKAAQQILREKPTQRIVMLFMERDSEQLGKLDRHLEPLKPFLRNLTVQTVLEDSRTLVPTLLSRVPELAPSFFMVDPYGHPLSLQVINEILKRPKTEVLINLMWFRVNMDLANPSMHRHLNTLFGDELWQQQPFMSLHGESRERSFLEYFISRTEARYVLQFRIGFDDKEDRISGERTKYYLLHASNNSRAVLLMKEVMWPLGDEEGTFDYSGKSQGVLISRTPREEELRDILIKEFAGRELSFDEIREKTWKLPFIEKHYRSVIQTLRKEGRVNVISVTSKGVGLSRRDRVAFLAGKG